MQNFGSDRSVEPKGAIPVSAWKLDNSREIGDKELRLRIDRVKIEEGSFHQLCSTYHYDENKIRERVFQIIEKRGKLHNPSTNSGGICCGVIDAIGKDYCNPENFQVGDKVICITSLTAIPMRLETIETVDFNYAQMNVTGYCILFETSPIVLYPEELKESYLLSALDESGSIVNVYNFAETGNRFLILGNNVLSVLLYAAAIRKKAAKKSRVVAVLDNAGRQILEEKKIEKILAKYIDKVYFADILSPMEDFQVIEAQEKELFDISVNCANLLGAETISVLFTKDQGSLFFTSLINNYNLAILFAESLGKALKTYSLDEYTQNYDKFTVALVREIKDDLEYLDIVFKKYPMASKLPTKLSEMMQMKTEGKIDDFVFASGKMKTLIETVLNIAEYDCNVIIQGETGVGKEKILNLIHQNCTRKMNPCVRINCATIQDSLGESEFFGYENGAFTGASTAGKHGYFELANNGILFLDEVGELSPRLQSKLLRVLQENQFFRVGGQTQISVNVRVICASNVELKKLVQEGKFREDLYYRLNICEINIPPLREREEDIICLAESFIKKYNDIYHQTKKLDQDAVQELLSYSWPGNVRELDNIMHRAVINSKDNSIDGEMIRHILASDLEKDEFSQNAITITVRQGLIPSLEEYEKELIRNALKIYRTTRKAAEILEISHSQFMRKKKKYAL